MTCDLSKHIESSTDMSEGGGEGVWATPPYLIAKQERIVEKGQSHPAKQQILAEDSDLNAVYRIAAEHTFANLLGKKRKSLAP